MGSYTFKINTVTQDLGTVKLLPGKRITNSITIPGFGDGQAPEVIVWGNSYKQYSFNGRFCGTESEINTFINNISNAESNKTQCTLQTRFNSTPVNCTVEGFDDIDNGGAPGYVDYILTVNEGNSIV